jgi:hypothetical protein
MGGTGDKAKLSLDRWRSYHCRKIDTPCAQADADKGDIAI